MADGNPIKGEAEKEERHLSIRPVTESSEGGSGLTDSPEKSLSRVQSFNLLCVLLLFAY